MDLLFSFRFRFSRRGWYHWLQSNRDCSCTTLALSLRFPEPVRRRTPPSFQFEGGLKSWLRLSRSF